MAGGGAAHATLPTSGSPSTSESGGAPVQSVLVLRQKLEGATVLGAEETGVPPVGGDDETDPEALGNCDRGSINKPMFASQYF